MAQTYILLDTIPGSVREVAEMLRELENVRTVDTVVGPHDIIAVVDTPDMDTLGDLLEKQVRTIPGVVRTTTCITMSS